MCRVRVRRSSQSVQCFGSGYSVQGIVHFVLDAVSILNNNMCGKKLSKVLWSHFVHKEMNKLVIKKNGSKIQ